MAPLEGVSYAAKDLPVSTLTVLVMLLANAVTLVRVKGLQWQQQRQSAGGDDEKKGVKANKRVTGLEWTAESVAHLCSELAVLSAILGYTWCAENFPVFEHGQKEHLPDFFWFICFMILMFAFGSIVNDKPRSADPGKWSSDIVNRDQTEEWKGWMQTVFLLYHYFHAAEVYNSVRVMISCYVWMTGFGNFSFFYAKRDFGFVRFAQMMWRLNFSVFFLCLTMNNMYVLYYICPLHTFYFLMVFVTMRVFSELNHTKYAIRVKLLVVGVLIFLVWEFDALFKVAFFMIPNTPHPGAAVGAYGVQYEWHFRTGLDHYSTFFGMIFACNFPQLTLWMERVESLPTAKHVAVKATVGSVLLGALYWWVTEIFPLPKLHFNSWNPYTFMIPLLAYLFFRNSTPWLRTVHLGILASIGKYTLETYLMQHHIWLTSNAKTLFTLIPGFPKINLICVTFIYFLVARRLFRITIVTRAILIPDNYVDALSNLAGVAGLVTAAAALAWTLQLAQASWPFVILMGLSFGAVLAWLVTARITSQQAVGSATQATSDRTALMRCAMAWAVCIVAVAGVPQLVPVGAPLNGGPLRPSTDLITPQQCMRRLTEGTWIDTSTRACVSKNSPVCSGESWVWTHHAEEHACGYRRFTSSEALPLLLDRDVIIIGDETGFQLAAALARLANPERGTPATLAAASGPDQHFMPKFVFPVGPEGPEQGRVVFVRADTSDQLLSAFRKAHIDNTIRDQAMVVAAVFEAELDAGTPALVYGSQVVSGLARIQNSLRETVPHLGTVAVAPGEVYDSKVVERETGLTSENAAAYRSALWEEAGDLSGDRPSFVLDLVHMTAGRPSATVDGLHFTPTTYAVAAEVLANAYDRLAPPPPHASKGPKKGSGGGVAISPLRGLAILVLAASMLFFMDNFGGLSVLSFALFARGFGVLTWEESVSVLHQNIEADTKSSLGAATGFSGSSASRNAVSYSQVSQEVSSDVEDPNAPMSPTSDPRVVQVELAPQ
ncbi:Protein REDUCED WALL ACETYLATION 1 [Durusdinium trenchii]|uniref:Protein REDUCED WALL ACETYLATION 1 n=1 Tax=Durusdinium trenchii TaxID=1381693 RepID=A0ABP0KSW1_9DINO